MANEIREEGTIVFSKEEFGDEFFNKVATQLELLTAAGYECLFYNEDCDIYVIKYAYHNFKYGSPSFELVSEDEYVDLQYVRGNQPTEKEEE